MTASCKKQLWLFFLVAFSSTLFSLPKYLFIEGNIGAGKSTLAKILEQELGVVCVQEPCDEWQDINGHNLLEAFYKDPKHWAVLFQINAFVTRVAKQQKHARIGGVFQIMERSWFSDKYCFALNAKESDLLNDMEWSLYCKMWDWYVHQGVEPSGFIYLRVEPEDCYKRMQKRARSEEGIVPLEYLKALHDRHEDWLKHDKFKEEQFGKIPVLVLDGSRDFKNDEKVQKDFARQILDFLKKHENIDFKEVK